MTLKELFKLIDYDTFYPEGQDDKGERKTRCWAPDHTDNEPSLYINLTTGLYDCKGCSNTGNALTYWTAVQGMTRQELFEKYGGGSETTKDDEPAAVISWAQVKDDHNRLMGIEGRLSYLLNHRGLSHAILVKNSIGWNGRRYSIPIVEDGEIVNIRRYDPNAKAKMKNIPGHGEGRLYPFVNIASADEIVICEGEMDCLLLQTHSIVAVTSTAGAGYWSPDWAVLFRGKTVYICYDIDAPGKLGGNKVAKALLKHAEAVHIISLPLKESEYPGGDITDYLMKAGYSAADFRNLMESSPALGVVEEVVDHDAVEVEFHKAAMAQYVNRRIKFSATVSAKDTQPYIVPKKVTAQCDMSQKSLCDLCPVAVKGTAGVLEHEYDLTQRDVLNMLACADDAQRMAHKRSLGVPLKCPVVAFDVTETENVEEIRLIPSVGSAANTNMLDSSEYVVRRSFFVGHGIKTNAQYDMECRTVAEPKQQHATHLIYDAKPAVDDLSNFTLDEGRINDLRSTFGVGEESVETRLNLIYQDLEANVTRIFGRRDLHLIIDLAYHSTLFLPFQGRAVKGYVEALVLGDSGQGKSECSGNLLRHYGVGERLDCKGATAAGLLGGVQETAKRWFVSWGKIPLNDRRLVILEEVKGIDVEVLAKLTDMRSSGVAEITKIEQQKTHARTRLIWLSNARAERQIAYYDYGVDAVRELFGNLEDVRRLDIAMCVASGEVDSKVFNCLEKDLPQAPHKATSGLCRDLVLWCWSRTPAQISFTDDATTAILAGAESLSAKYDANIPLVEPADQRYKIARLSAAMAGRVFSTKDGVNLIVTQEHVEVTLRFMERVYDAPFMRYNEYSVMQRLRNQSVEDAEFLKKFKMSPRPKALAKGLFNSKVITKMAVAAYSGMSGLEGKSFADDLVAFLLRNHAVFAYFSMWKKEYPFTNWLRTAIPRLPDKCELPEEDDI